MGHWGCDSLHQQSTLQNWQGSHQSHTWEGHNVTQDQQCPNKALKTSQIAAAGHHNASYECRHHGPAGHAHQEALSADWSRYDLIMEKLENHKVAKLFCLFHRSLTRRKIHSRGPNEDLFLTQKNKRVPNLKWNSFLFQDGKLLAHL